MVMGGPIVLTEYELEAINGGEWSWSAFVGAIIGGAVGGAIAGGGVGALAGGVGGAVGYAATEAWNYFF